MKKTLFTTLALLLLSFFVSAQNGAPDQTADTKTVLKLCNDWDDAYIKKDPAPLDKILATDYIGIDEEGGVTSKSDEINLIKTGEYILLSVEHIEPPQVRFYGTTAVVTTHAKVKQTYKGDTTTAEGRATTVCSKQSGAWQIASWHASKVH
jgi:ketosteroid isomerase-like protein